MRLLRISMVVVTGIIMLLGTSFEARAESLTFIAESTFDSNDEGWIVQDLLAECATGFTFTPDYYSTGGNPGGYISEDDPTTNSFFFSAPAKFLGNMEIAYDGCLNFDWIATGTGAIISVTADVVLIGAGLAIYIDTPSPAKTWTTQTACFWVEAGWVKCNGDTVVTEEEMRSVLASLDMLLIRGDHITEGADTGGLDNVKLRLSCIPVEESSWGRIKALYR